MKHIIILSLFLYPISSWSVTGCTIPFLPSTNIKTELNPIAPPATIFANKYHFGPTDVNALSYFLLDLKIAQASFEYVLNNQAHLKFKGTVTKIGFDSLGDIYVQILKDDGASIEFCIERITQIEVLKDITGAAPTTATVAVTAILTSNGTPLFLSAILQNWFSHGDVDLGVESKTTDDSYKNVLLFNKLNTKAEVHYTKTSGGNILVSKLIFTDIAGKEEFVKYIGNLKDKYFQN
jgi:hypothetical protein